MVCEGLLNYFGTSSKEIAENATKQTQEFYQPQIEKLTSDNILLTSENTLLHSEIAKYKKLLEENNISY